MRSPRGAGTPPGWRAGRGVPLLPSVQERRSRWRFVVFIAGALLAVALGVSLLLVPRSAPQPHFLPLCVTAYESPSLRAPACLRHDQERLCALFDRVAAKTWSPPRRAELLRSLDELANLRSDDEAVIYLSGHATLTDAGVQILPADAVPEDPNTWMPLVEVLKLLKRSPARHQLLILDLAHEDTWARWGTPPEAVAAAIPADLDAVPDERRLVLCSCDVGQTAHDIALLGCSAFAHYLAEGLRGRADGYGPAGCRDGRVSVRELAAYVQARVPRSVSMHRGAPQHPPLLGQGPDFALASFTTPPAQSAPAQRAAKMPPWLGEAWEICERMLRDGSFRRNPRAFQRMQNLVLQTGEACRSSPVAIEAQNSFLKQFEDLRSQFLAPSPPAGFSLAQETARKASVHISKIQESLLQLQQQCARAKPEESERMKARFLTNWTLTTLEAPVSERDQAVLNWLTDKTAADSPSIYWADALLRAGGDAEPRFTETLTVRLLADLAQRTPQDAWSETLAQQVLTLAQLAEQPLCHPESLSWFRADLNAAAQCRHEGEMALWARGYVPVDRAAKLLSQAERQYLEVNRRVEKLASAQELADRAMMALPGYRPLLDVQPEQQSTWQEAVRLNTALMDLLSSSPLDREARDQTLARIGADAEKLREHLQTLAEASAPARVERLVQQSEAADAGAAILAELEALLAMGAGWLQPGNREKAHQAALLLANRLQQKIRALDCEEDAGTAGQSSQSAEAGQGRTPTPPVRLHQCRGDVALLELGGVAADRLIPLRQAAARLETKGVGLAAWIAWGQAVRDLYALGIPAQLASERSLERKERVSRILPPGENWPAVDAGESLAVRLHRQQVHETWTWLAERYRYQAQDYESLGLDTPGNQAAQRFFAAAAAATAALPPASFAKLKCDGPVERLHAGRVSTTAALTLERFTPTGKAGAT